MINAWYNADILMIGVKALMNLTLQSLNNRYYEFTNQN